LFAKAEVSLKVGRLRLMGDDAYKIPILPYSQMAGLADELVMVDIAAVVPLEDMAFDRKVSG
jgi:hypothetical protein